MKRHSIKHSFLHFIMLTFFLAGCGDSNETGPDDSDTGNLSLTKIVTTTNFVGDTITIEGTGFSAIAANNEVRFYSHQAMEAKANCANIVGVESGLSNPVLNGTYFKGKVITATSTRITVQVPYCIYSIANNYRAVIMGATAENYIAVKVNGAITQPQESYFEFPVIATRTMFEFSSFYPDQTIRINIPQYAPKGLQYVLEVDGKRIDYEMDNTNINFPAKAFFSKEDFADPLICNGRNARAVPFKFYLKGKDLNYIDSIGIAYLPLRTISSATFVSDCPGNAKFTIGLSPGNAFASSVAIAIPLAIMDLNCTYSIFLDSPCFEKGSGGIFEKIGTVRVNP